MYRTCFDIFEAPLEPIDLSQINHDDLENFEMETVMKSGHPLTSRQENVLRARSIFSVHMVEGLLKVVFWYNCKCFSVYEVVTNIVN